MILRMIPFGYAVENGKNIINEYEANIVWHIFSEYVNGKILREIAEELTARQVVFYGDKTVWNKNMVCRIIENGRYAGEQEDYPAIVPYDLFAKANAKKTEKGYKKAEQLPTVLFLKKIARCGVCSKPLVRRSKWKTREKWLCDNGCKYGAYIDDAKIMRGIKTVLERVRDTPKMLQVERKEPTYTHTQEILRYTNEIGRLLDEPSPSFAAGKKLILSCAAKKFCACSEDAATAYTDFVLREIALLNMGNELSADFLKKTVEKVMVDENGTVMVRFVNGVELGSANANSEQ